MIFFFLLKKKEEYAISYAIIRVCGMLQKPVQGGKEGYDQR
jgi:hypothetical protein